MTTTDHHRSPPLQASEKQTPADEMSKRGLIAIYVCTVLYSIRIHIYYVPYVPYSVSAVWMDAMYYCGQREVTPSLPKSLLLAWT